MIYIIIIIIKPVGEIAPCKQPRKVCKASPGGKWNGGYWIPDVVSNQVLDTRFCVKLGTGYLIFCLIYYWMQTCNLSNLLQQKYSNFSILSEKNA